MELTILERLKYCKKVADMKKGNFDLITYADKQDLKNQTIEEIQKMARLAYMHYNSCYESASKMFSEDENIGLAVLFSYDYFNLFHLCLVDFFEKHKLDEKNNYYINLKNKIC